MATADLLDRPDLAAAARSFAAACENSRRWSAMVSDAVAKYGRPSAAVAGIYSDDFPSDVKEGLRALALRVTHYLDDGYARRPSRVRMSTMRRLASAVATRDGSGYYGPQPTRVQ